MKLDTSKIAISSAAAFALVWLLCSLLVLALPSSMMNMSGHMVHGDLSDMGWHMTFTGVALGLLAWSFVAGLTGGLIAYVYNKLN